MHKIFQATFQALEESWPKALGTIAVSLATYLVKYLWKRWSGGNQTREAELRQELVSLKQLDETALTLEDEVEANKLREHARKRRNQVVAELIALTTEDKVPAPNPAIPVSAPVAAIPMLAIPVATVPAVAIPAAETAAPPTPLPSWRRWLLLYAPGGVLPWIFHVLFYLCATFVLLGCMVMLGSLHDPELGDMALGFGIIAVLGLVFRGLAIASRKPARAAAPLPASTRKGIRRWLLLYWPSSLLATLIHMIYFGFVTALLLGLIATFSSWSEDPESAYALLGFAVILPIPIGLAAVANRLASRQAAKARPAI